VPPNCSIRQWRDRRRVPPGALPGVIRIADRQCRPTFVSGT
jgi:hypothetical protein